MAERGPTQGAERHQQSLAQGWTARPRLARILRLFIFVAPLLLSFAFSVAAGRIAPADELGMNRWLWIAIVFVLANILLLVLRRMTARLIPLVALMKLTLVFPDNAPSRTKAALRTSNSRTMLRAMREAQARCSTSGEATHGDYLVQLLREVNEHDRLTRGHSERVRAYAEMLGVELGLNDEDLNKLRWAALLHDVGKLSVPSEILNKPGRPTDEEWKVLSGHPAAALPLLEPLRDWLGDWIHAADQHHCRWDGGGYPSKLSGTDITLAGRIVAIADAYDVMTSARSYKKPLAPEVARQELTDCAGKQFDPGLVRVFLRIGLGRLRSVAGPLAWVSNLTGSAQLPVPAANAVSSGAWSVGVAATGLVTVGATGMYSPPPPEAIALDTPVVMAMDATVAATAGGSFEVVLSAIGDDLDFRVADAAHGTVALVRFPELVDEITDDGVPMWEAVATYTPATEYIGEDGFSFEVCNPDQFCDQGAVTLQLLEPAPAVEEPTTTSTSAPATTSTAEPTTTADPATSVAPTTAAPTTAPATTAPPTTAPATTAPATTAPATTAPATTAPPTTVRPNLGPTAEADAVTIVEDQVVLIAVLANDSDPEGDELTITGVGGPIRGAATIAGDQIRYVPDVNSNGSDRFTYTISDGVNPGVAATIDVTITPVNDPPMFTLSNVAVDENTSVGTVLLTVDAVDPEGDPLDFAVLDDPTGRFAVDGSGVVRLVAALDHENAPFHDIRVRVSDGVAEAVRPVRIVVGDVDEPPTPLADTAVVTEDSTASISIGSNDQDPEGGALSWTVPATSTQGGSLSEVSGVVTYTPANNFNGSDSFVYEVRDAAGNVAGPVSVSITVTPVNDAPVASDDTLTVDFAGSSTTGDLRLNDADVDGDALVISAVSDGAFGTVVSNGDGTATYTHDGSGSSTDTFTYTVRDPSGATDIGSVIVSIGAPFDRDGIEAGDNCPTAYNPNQLDTDGDGIGDVCDPSSTVPSSASFGGVGASIGGAPRNSVAVVAADFDGDGDNDLVFANDGIQNRFVRNIGSAMFETSEDLGTGDSLGVAVGDMDGDGDFDVVFADNGTTNLVYLNDGTGSFALVPQTVGANQSWAVAVGDVDADGDLDAIFANVGGPNTVWLNDGAGGLTLAASLGSSDSKGISVGDLNGDQHLDLVFSNDGQDDEIWFNDGTGGFSASSQTLETGRSHATALGDLDGDGDLDIVIAGDNDGDSVWLNDGGGTFVRKAGTLGLGHSRAVALGDLDGDGDLDIAFGDHSGPNSVWLNNGLGQFTDSGQRIDSGGNDATEGIVLVDLDGDGDLGIISANDGDLNRTHGNT